MSSLGAVITVTAGFWGAQSAGSVGPKSRTQGSPQAAARWLMPLS